MFFVPENEKELVYPRRDKTSQRENENQLFKQNYINTPLTYRLQTRFLLWALRHIS